eukprot:TRINITY_DN6143_c0_g1_i1.p2 TRINITY_DN6143_c0_g1~~TRINITY_DN6143_c0_g1_i1.p2  ORF type:complete len:153 (-),score=36.04 TRINITY_DN6143_c0_g1_i1:73-531(-)
MRLSWHRMYDLLCPTPQEDFGVIICDPPFFQVSVRELFNAVSVLAKQDFSTKILIAFVARNETELLRVFAPFAIRRTTFRLSYTTVKSSRWSNYALYSNWDAPGMKRIGAGTSSTKKKKKRKTATAKGTGAATRVPGRPNTRGKKKRGPSVS